MPQVILTSPKDLSPGRDRRARPALLVLSWFRSVQGNFETTLQV